MFVSTAVQVADGQGTQLIILKSSLTIPIPGLYGMGHSMSWYKLGKEWSDKTLIRWWCCQWWRMQQRYHFQHHRGPQSQCWSRVAEPRQAGSRYNDVNACVNNICSSRLQGPAAGNSPWHLQPPDPLACCCTAAIRRHQPLLTAHWHKDQQATTGKMVHSGTQS